MTAARIGAVVIVASTVAVDPWGATPFGPARWSVVTVGVLAVVALTRPWRLRSDRLVRLWAALLAWLALATVLAVDPLHAWIGTPDRRLGLLAWLLSAAAFLAGRRLGHGRVTLAIGWTIAAVVAGAWSLLELVDRAPVDVEFAGNRLGGPWGQPAFLGAAAALMFPTAAGLGLDAGLDRRVRVFGAVGATVAVVALLGAQTRAAWVGLLGGILLVTPRLVPSLRAHARAVAVAAVLLVIVAAATPIGGRAVSVVDPDGIEASGRLDEWRVASRAIGQRPILGSGPEGYRVVFADAVDAEYQEDFGREVLPDRAHNALLDVAAVGGLPALVLFVAILTLVVRAELASIRRERWAVAGMAVGVVAFVGQSMFLFPTAELDPLFWLTAGAAVGAGQATRRGSGSIDRALVTGVAVVASVTFVAGALEVTADRRLDRAIERLDAGDETAALAAVDGATDLRPDSIRLWFAAARIAESGDTILAVDAALDRIEQGLDRSPVDPALRTEHTRLLLVRAERSGLAVDAQAAIAALEVLAADDPVEPLHRARLDRAREISQASE